MNYESTGEFLDDNPQSQKPPKEDCRGNYEILDRKSC
jgi:hypothetical protein